MVLPLVMSNGDDVLEPLWSNSYDAVVINFEYKHTAHIQCVPSSADDTEERIY